MRHSVQCYAIGGGPGHDHCRCYCHGTAEGDPIKVEDLMWALQEHQDRHAAEGALPRYHCAGMDCASEIAENYNRSRR
jgi:hypothetical protein